MDEFKPVAFDPKAHAARKREGNPAFRDAHDALDDEFAALAVLLKARKDAGLTQAEVATKMDVPNPCWHASNQPRQPQTRPLSLDPAQVRQRPRQATGHSDAVTKYAASRSGQTNSGQLHRLGATSNEGGMEGVRCLKK